jgi:hypothetical protein
MPIAVDGEKAMATKYYAVCNNFPLHGPPGWEGSERDTQGEAQQDCDSHVRQNPSCNGHCVVLPRHV